MPGQAATLRSQSLGWVRLSSLMANDEYTWPLMQGNTMKACIRTASPYLRPTLNSDNLLENCNKLPEKLLQENAVISLTTQTA